MVQDGIKNREKICPERAGTSGRTDRQMDGDMIYFIMFGFILFYRMNAS